MRRHAALGLLSALLASQVGAQDLSLPAAARLTLEETEALGRYEIAIGPWTPASFPRFAAEGSVSRLVWQVSPYSGTTAQLLAPLQAQLEAAGYETLFECADRACGGFDFRFGLDISAEPAMHVNLGDFGYLAARRAGREGAQDLALMVSRGGGGGYIHMVSVGPPGEAPPDITLSSRAPDPEAAMVAGDLIATLEATGAATLDDLRFETGSSSLAGQDYPSLSVLAAYLAQNPERRVVLVGHTDAEGALENNIALSRSRASAVRGVLISALGVSPEQLRAEGVGYLAPRAPNTTDDGRERNRRVEVVLTNIN